VFIYGNTELASRTSSGFSGGGRIGADLSIAFERRDPVSIATLVPAMLDRAALFRGLIAAPWALGLLGGLALILVPLFLVRALRAAGDDGASSSV
jgi:hypothetical protein